MKTLVVQVVDAFDQSPVYNAIVRIYRNNRPIAVTNTDTNGIAVFELPETKATYRIEVKDQLHFPKEETISFPEQDSIMIKLVKRTWGR